MKSQMIHNFQQNESVNIGRSIFNRSSTHKTTFDGGYLVPVYVDEVLPGDTMNLKHHNFTRFTTPIVPIMDNIHIETFFFFVPNRIIWSNWQKFLGAVDDPSDTTLHVAPYVIAPQAPGWPVGSIFDYMGLPTGIAGVQASALPLRAYNLIYNEWFRDQNLISPVTVDTGDGNQPVNDFTLLKRSKRKDYFTRALPWPQKGPDVYLPLGTSAPIYGNGKGLTLFDGTLPAAMVTDADGYSVKVSTGSYNRNTGSAAVWTTYNAPNTVLGVPKKTDVYNGNQMPSNIYADLSEATAAKINDIRLAFQVQKYYEKCARGGTRHTEWLYSHFGVINPDFRLQRPEFLGGDHFMMNINQVMQTSPGTAESTPLGFLGAYGSASNSKGGFNKSFTEHGIIIGLMCVTADLTYQQGLDKMWSRDDKFDFYLPEFSHIGEQPIRNKEIFCANDSNDDLVFGYTEAWDDYRYKRSLITGKFRSTVNGTLDTWHLAQNFRSLPALTYEFMEEDPPFARVLAIQDEPQFMTDNFFEVYHSRPIPVYSTPGLLDHF